MAVVKLKHNVKGNTYGEIIFSSDKNSVSGRVVEKRYSDMTAFNSEIFESRREI